MARGQGALCQGAQGQGARSREHQEGAPRWSTKRGQREVHRERSTERGAQNESVSVFFFVFLFFSLMFFVVLCFSLIFKCFSVSAIFFRVLKI